MAARRRQRQAHQLKPSVRCTPSLFDETGHLEKIEYFCKYLAPRLISEIQAQTQTQVHSRSNSDIAGLTAQEAITETAGRMEILLIQMNANRPTDEDENGHILTLALAEGNEGRIVKLSLLPALTENQIRWSEDSVRSHIIRISLS
ncbi:hypothetical protein R3P38DRAFT_2813299 [Favolaschia claudopus]|uniref:Uncharacterized protein n=1 Tax=Favolaschia claudopus TaxID=2862362 RepID=A0AAV9Z5K4_9AGAR